MTIERLRRTMLEGGWIARCEVCSAYFATGRPDWFKRCERCARRSLGPWIVPLHGPVINDCTAAPGTCTVPGCPNEEPDPFERGAIEVSGLSVVYMTPEQLRERAMPIARAVRRGRWHRARKAWQYGRAYGAPRIRALRFALRALIGLDNPS